jgi:hypothetical protein
MSTNSKGRSPENTQITVNMPRVLETRIRAAAAADDRKMAPWVVLQLTKLLDARDKELAKGQGDSEAPASPLRSFKANDTDAKRANSRVGDIRRF